MTRVELVTNVNSVKVGEPFLVAAHFQMKPDWHIYWENPGETGLPTSIKLASEAAIQVGEIQWPLPEKFMQGPLVGYGYSHQVLLQVPVTLTERPPGEESVSIDVKLRWLNCSGTLCVPDRKQLQIQLPIAEESTFSKRELFDRWKSTLPVPVHELFGQDGLSMRGTLLGSDAPCVLSVPSTLSHTAVQIFPIDNQEIVVEPIKVSPNAVVTELHLQARTVEENTSFPESIEALLVVTDERGIRKGAKVLLPIARP